MSAETKSSICLTVFTGLTMLVVVYYTVETYRLRKAAEEQLGASRKQVDAAEKQNETQILPIVVLDSDGTKLILRNLGNGPALDVGDVRLTAGGKFWLNHQALIPPGQLIATTGLSLAALTKEVKSAKAVLKTAARDACIRYQGADGVWHETDQLLDVGETNDLIIRYGRTRTFASKEAGEAACR